MTPEQLAEMTRLHLGARSALKLHAFGNLALIAALSVFLLVWSQPVSLLLSHLEGQPAPRRVLAPGEAIPWAIMGGTGLFCLLFGPMLLVGHLSPVGLPGSVLWRRSWMRSAYLLQSALVLAVVVVGIGIFTPRKDRHEWASVVFASGAVWLPAAVLLAKGAGLAWKRSKRRFAAGYAPRRVVAGLALSIAFALGTGVVVVLAMTLLAVAARIL